MKVCQDRGMLGTSMEETPHDRGSSDPWPVEGNDASLIIIFKIRKVCLGAAKPMEKQDDLIFPFIGSYICQSMFPVVCNLIIQHFVLQIEI